MNFVLVECFLYRITEKEQNGRFKLWNDLHEISPLCIQSSFLGEFGLINFATQVCNIFFATIYATLNYILGSSSLSMRHIIYS